MQYSIRHLTQFRYSAQVSESMTDARMQPRSDAHQRCVSFELTISPHARVQHYSDHLGNAVHHFDVPQHHGKLSIIAKAAVEMLPRPDVPDELGADAWDSLDAMVAQDDFCEFLIPSHFTQGSQLSAELGRELRVERRDDPLRLLRELNTAIYRTFDYVPQSTSVDSPIDTALRDRKGVCQDFAHVFLTLLRPLGIPCRYVSGYLYHRTEDSDRSAVDATHAWIEACLPGIGWIGLDPTNDLIAGCRHIAVAVGRDYSDVPPTRGVFKGKAKSELSVAVKVVPTADPSSNALPQPVTVATSGPAPDEEEEQEQAYTLRQRQRMQQQQQQQ